MNYSLFEHFLTCTDNKKCSNNNSKSCATANDCVGPTYLLDGDCGIRVKTALKAAKAARKECPTPKTCPEYSTHLATAIKNYTLNSECIDKVTKAVAEKTCPTPTPIDTKNKDIYNIIFIAVAVIILIFAPVFYIYINNSNSDY